MKPNDSTLLAWAGELVAQAQAERLFGTVTIHLQEGRITRVEKQASFVPPAPGRTVRETSG